MSAKTWEKIPSSVLNPLASPSPATMDYSDAFYDSNNTSIKKYCPNGMKCNSLKNKMMPACPWEHVENHEQLIAEEKKKYEMMQEKPPTINTSSPVPFVDNGYSIEIAPQMIGDSVVMAVIPNAIYGSATVNKNGTITYSIIYNNVPATAIVPTATVATATVPTATVAAVNAPIVSAIASTATATASAPAPATIVKSTNSTMGVSFGAKQNSISSVASKNEPSNLAKLQAQEQLDIKKENNDGFEIFSSKKNSKQVKTDETSGRTSPIPKTSARNSPVPKMTSSKKPCKFNYRCNKKDCTFEHPDGYVPGSISSDMCSYHIGINKKTGQPNQCYKLNCTFKHPDGYVPKPNVRCLGGGECSKEKAEDGSCYFSHPWDEYWNTLPENKRKY